MVVTTTKFRALTNQVASSLGMPQLRIVEVEHPLGGTAVGTVQSWADEAAGAALDLFLGSAS